MRHNIYIYILIILSILCALCDPGGHDLSGNGGSHTESGRRSSGTDLWDLGGMVSWGLV